MSNTQPQSPYFQESSSGDTIGSFVAEGIEYTQHTLTEPVASDNSKVQNTTVSSSKSKEPHGEPLRKSDSLHLDDDDEVLTVSVDENHDDQAQTDQMSSFLSIADSPQTSLSNAKSPRLHQLPNIPISKRKPFTSTEYAIVTFKVLNYLTQPLNIGHHPQLLIGQVTKPFPTLAHLKHLGISTVSTGSTNLEVPSWLLRIGTGDLVYIIWPSPTTLSQHPSLTQKTSWWKGMFNGQIGYFPSDSITILDPNLFTKSAQGLNLLSLTKIPASLTNDNSNTPQFAASNQYHSQSSSASIKTPDIVGSIRTSLDELYSGFKSAHPDARRKVHLDHAPAISSSLSSYVAASAPTGNTLNRSISLSFLSKTQSPRSTKGNDIVPPLSLDRFSSATDFDSPLKKKQSFFSTLISPRGRKPKRSLYDSKTFSLTNLESILHNTSSPSVNSIDPSISPRGAVSIPDDFHSRMSQDSREFGPGLSSLSPRQYVSTSHPSGTRAATATGSGTSNSSGDSRSNLIPFPPSPTFISHSEALANFHTKFDSLSLQEARKIPLPLF